MLYDTLLPYRDEKYRQMQIRLLPNVSEDTIIGVRTPVLRKIAKELAKREEKDGFLAELPHRFFEENMLHFFIVSEIKDFDLCVFETERFLPYVDNWALCDQSSPKVFKKHRKELLPFVKKWIASEHTYTARFGIRMLMNEYLEEDFKEEYLSLVASKKGDDYYLKMMIAWYFATALAKQYSSTLPYIENRILDPWTHKKAIQKAVESYRVSEEHKAYLKTLR